ncbi:hypothetical protein Javan452_0005 [Streptococcus phage Javan452]|nr:hypothetical protein Javan452_0005 [Streptococcus phage Javan452]
MDDRLVYYKIKTPKREWKGGKYDIHSNNSIYINIVSGITGYDEMAYMECQ